jgi:hypothetical protein
MQSFTFRIMAPTTAALALTLASAAAQANLDITFTQTASEVKVVWDGSLNTSFFKNGTFRPNPAIGVNFDSVRINTGPANAAIIQWEAGDSSTVSTLPFLTATTLQRGAFDGGDAMNLFVADFGGFEIRTGLRLPVAYVSGRNLHSAGTWSGSFSSLGVIPTPYVINLYGNQTINVNFVDATAAVPEPSAAALTGAALAVVGLLRCRARQKPQTTAAA